MKFFTNITEDCLNEYRAWNSYRKQLVLNKNRLIRFYNWWSGAYESMWLYRFVKARNLIPENQILNFVSVFGRKEIIRYINDGPIIFFSGENLHARPEYMDYADYCLFGRKANLGIGFDYFDYPHYVRMSGLHVIANPEAEENEIRKLCEEIRYPKLSQRPLFASMIARSDIFGNRAQICSQLEFIDKIYCPSIVNHNDDTLIKDFHNNKVSYLQQFVFNICPENTNSYGYVTEKIYEAITAGCIPIYWGSFNKPDLDIINPDAVILWNQDGNNDATIRLIEELWHDKDKLRAFLNQPRLKEGAEDVIIAKLEELENKIKELYL